MKTLFLHISEKYTSNHPFISTLWQEIEANYSKRNRHYHTLDHLEHMLNQFNAIKTEISEWDATLFALYYHDIIYNPLKSDNESKSADLAVKRMHELDVPIAIIEQTKTQILATKSHEISSDNDVNFFTDIDLSVLGQTWPIYAEYARNVRKEYAIYPDLIYNAGRKKVLNHFLAMDRIFKTEKLNSKFELQAKRNIEKELRAL